MGIWEMETPSENEINTTCGAYVSMKVSPIVMGFFDQVYPGIFKVNYWQ